MCHSHCGGSCPIRVNVKDGIATGLETRDECRACFKGRAYRQRLYAPDRLKFPLRRTGERGQGKFQRISWEEAFETVAARLKQTRDAYGPSAILLTGSQGDIAWLHHGALVEKLLLKFGGYSGTWGSPSGEAGLFAVATAYGMGGKGNGREDLLNSRLIILWGWNPAVSCAFGSTPLYLARAKEAGARIVCVDPRYTESAAALADQWVPVRPGTDTAMMAALAWVIITEGLCDSPFIQKHTHGFEEYRRYILGEEDGVPKTPTWAEGVTGVPAATTATLAREMATRRPVALLDGFAPGRSAYGEQYHRAAIALAAMTGNIGIHGGSPPGGQAAMGDTLGPLSLGPFVGSRIPGGDNPVDMARPPRPDAVVARKFMKTGSLMGSVSAARVHRTHLADAILQGTSGGYPADYHFLYVVNHNYINQVQDSNRIHQALSKLDFIVVHEQFMTPIARYADIIFTANSYLERDDVTSGGIGPFHGYMNKAVEPMDDSKSHFEIVAGLASRLGISGFEVDSSEEWLRKVVASSKDIPDYDEFKASGIHSIALAEPYVCFKEQIADPERHPFPTPSGKIEISSSDIAALHNPMLPPVPKYIEPWEGPRDPLAAKYPLQLVTTHAKRRAHSQFDNIPWLRELIPQAVTINTQDAERRGIKNGDIVMVLNDRGRVTVFARVTDRIMPGVVEIPQGAWYNPDASGVDRGGCTNTLTAARISPGGGFCFNTCLVEVRNAE